MRRRGGRRNLVLIASLIAGALPVLAQDAPKAPPKNRLLLQAWETEVHPEPRETLVVLLGEAHVSFESAPPRKKRGANAESQFLDVRADNAVAFIPSEADLREHGAPAVRALYAEGHVRLAQHTPGSPAFVLEAERLWLDLTGERAYAVNAVARMPGGRKVQTLVGPNPKTTRPGASSFQLRARRLRIEGTDTLVAEGASLSACDFGLPHEALEATTIAVSEVREKRRTPDALEVTAALGDTGGAAIAHRAVRDDPYRIFRDMTRRRAEPREGSDALFHAFQTPRFVEGEGAALRVRPPYVGEDGFAVPMPLPLGWETDWPFPDLRLGHSSKWGWYELGSLRVPLLRAGVLHDSKDRHVKDGLDLDVKGGGGFYEEIGGTGEGGARWEYFSNGERVARGHFEGTYIYDRQLRDRNGAVVPDEDRYWIRGVHQEELPLGVHLDAEVSKQSDRNYLLEWDRSAALTQKPQETYIYLRRTWDDLGARLDASARLNDFQTQTEDLPRARVDWLVTPVFAQPVLGGLYFTVKEEIANFRRRIDEFQSLTPLPDERLLREDVEGRLDYKLGILDKVYLRAYGSGRFTDWTERQRPDGSTDEHSIDRFLGTVGARAGTQFDAPFVLSDSGFTLRHVLIPEVGYEDRLLDTRDPSEIVQIDEVDTYRRGNYVFGRIRNRLQWADDPGGKGSHELLDVTIEGRYFPTSERLAPQQQIWGTIFSDARLYLGTEGTLRAVAEVDPNRHRLLRLDATASWFVSRSVGKWLGETKQGDGREHRGAVFPDIALDAGYHELADLSRFVGWGVDVRFTPSWGARLEELYDVDRKHFLRHRFIVRRYFHGFAVELDGSWDPILHDTSVSFAFVPFFEGSEPDLHPALDFSGY